MKTLMTEVEISRGVLDAAFVVHSKQVLTQLRLSQRKLGLLINLGETHLKNGIRRIVNGLPESPFS